MSNNTRTSCVNYYRSSVYAGIKWDVEDFLWKFREKKSLAYVDFASVWQLKSFTFIFADQDQLKSLEILCETCFFIVKKYIKLHSELSIQIGAFYLLYGLYYKQPVEHLYKIRLTLDEFKFIKSLMERIKVKGNYDILYIYAKMLSDCAFKFVACPRSLGIIKYNHFIEEYDLFTVKKADKLIKKVENLFEEQTIKDLIQTCTDYDKKLQKFVEKQDDMVAFDSKFIQNLMEEHGKIVSNFDVQVWKPRKEGATTRAVVKKKAMKNMNAQYRGEKQVLTADSLEEKSAKKDKQIVTDEMRKDFVTFTISYDESGLPDLSAVKEEN